MVKSVQCWIYGCVWKVTRGSIQYVVQKIRVIAWFTLKSNVSALAEIAFAVKCCMSPQSEITFKIQLCYNADVLRYGLNQALAVLQLALRDIEETNKRGTGSLLSKWKKTEWNGDELHVLCPMRNANVYFLSQKVLKHFQLLVLMKATLVLSPSWATTAAFCSFPQSAVHYPLVLCCEEALCKQRLMDWCTVGLVDPPGWLWLVTVQTSCLSGRLSQRGFRGLWSAWIRDVRITQTRWAALTPEERERELGSEGVWRKDGMEERGSGVMVKREN